MRAIFVILAAVPLWMIIRYVGERRQAGHTQEKRNGGFLFLPPSVCY
jgi:hypothetical protein